MRKQVIFHKEFAAFNRRNIVPVHLNIVGAEVGLDAKHLARLVIDRNDVRLLKPVLIEVYQPVLLKQ